MSIMFQDMLSSRLVSVLICNTDIIVSRRSRRLLPPLYGDDEEDDDDRHV